MQDHGYYGPGSVTWKLGREAIVMVGGARAVLMQLAHPLVATGVSEHSSYMSDPFGRTVRTFMLGNMLAFGDSATARRAARYINRLHYHVHGTLPASAGVYESGTYYDARDPELLLWVHATLVDTILLTYTLFIGPLGDEEKEQYYQESKEGARLLGLPPKYMPSTIEDLEQYVNDMVYSNRLAATPQARELAHMLLLPPVPAFLHPLVYVNLQVTSALLPEPLREIYGLKWGTLRQRAFDLSTLGSRTVLPHLPMYFRELSIVRRMMEKTLSQPA